MRQKIKFFLFITSFFMLNIGLANTAHDLGRLTKLYFTRDSGENYYSFTLPTATTISIFLNGLSAGYQINLLDTKGNILQAASNTGTKWESPANPGVTGGAMVIALNADTYYVHVTPTTITGNSLYKNQDNSYTLNLIPDNTPSMVTVAAYDSAKIGTTTFTATGINDQDTLNQAIAAVGNQGGGIILLRPGTYNIYNNVLTTFDNITLMGTGWNTILKLASNVTLQRAGLIRSAFVEPDKNDIITHFNNQHILHMALDGNKGSNLNFKNSYGIYGTFVLSSFEDMRIHDFPHYGFDPHRNVLSTPRFFTDRLTIKESLSDHNNIDGMTTDGCQHSIFQDNIIDANSRHGINVCTGSTDNSYLNNVITNNGVNGITIHPGGDLSPPSNNNIIMGNILRNNKKNGIYVYRTQNTHILNNLVTHTYSYGIHLRSSSNSVVSKNIVHNNYLEKSGRLIYMSHDKNIFSTHNLVIDNELSTSAPQLHKYGVAEATPDDDYNLVYRNALSGVFISLKGPHSKLGLAS